MARVLQTHARLELKLPTVDYGNLLLDVGVIVEDDGSGTAQDQANDLAMEQLMKLREQVDKLDESFFEKT